MNYIKFVAVVFVLYFLGHVLGPTIAPMLVKERKSSSDLTRVVEYKGAQYKINLAEYRDDRLPETVKIIKSTHIPTASGEGKVILKEGDLVTLLNREGEEIIVEKANANGKGSISPTDTDLYLQLAQAIYDEEAGAGAGATVAQVTPQPQPQAQPVAVATKVMPKKDPEPEPETMKKPMVDVPVAEPVAAEPVVASTPTPEKGGKLSDEEIIALMKESVASGAVKEFTIDQVKGWKATGDETIDGTEYQTGLAAYDAATIFGVQSVKAKALIKDGKVERWVYANSGMEIQ